MRTIHLVTEHRDLQADLAYLPDDIQILFYDLDMGFHAWMRRACAGPRFLLAYGPDVEAVLAPDVVFVPFDTAAGVMDYRWDVPILDMPAELPELVDMLHRPPVRSG